MTDFITLSELQNRISGAVNAAFPLSQWISAEIGELGVNAKSGHCYLELIESDGRSGQPKARAKAVVWRYTYPALAATFAAATGTPLSVGQRVLVKVTVSYHPMWGMSLQITDIDPSFTLGEQALKRRQTIERLQQDGVFELNGRLAEQLVPLRIAVVSASGAAGYGDFVGELDKSGYPFRVKLFEAFMQGAGAEESILSALESIANLDDRFDAVALLRGGGARSDLECFDSYMLCFAIAQFQLPVYTGIGHDRDLSVADMVAHRSLKTPTAVAQYFVGRVTDFDRRIDECSTDLDRIVERTISVNRILLDRFADSMRSAVGNTLHDCRLRLQSSSAEIVRRAGRAVDEQRARLERSGVVLKMSAVNAVQRQRQAIESAERLVDSRRPEHILALGFAVVRHNGSAVTDAGQLKAGDEVEIALLNGKKRAQIR